MPAQELINKYCVNPKTYQLKHPGEKWPKQVSITDMENHRIEGYVDGIAYFTAVQQEMIQLLNSSTPNRFFYMTAWHLGLSQFTGVLRIKNTFNEWDFNANFDEFPLPVPALNPGKNFETLLSDMVKQGVDVRILPWVSPNMVYDFVEAKIGKGDVNFHTLKSVSNLRNLIGEERVVLNLLAHTFGAVHCKLFVCGDKNKMKAFVSGIDPEIGRLNPSGSSQTNVYTASDVNELNDIIDALTNSKLSQNTYDICTYLNPYPNISIPDFTTFANGYSNGVNSFNVDLINKEEWYLTLEIEDSNKRGYVITYIYHIKIDGFNIKIYSFSMTGWHDVGVSLEGSAAGAVCDFFNDMWNEQLSREVETFLIDNDTILSHKKKWQPLPTRTPISLAANTGNQYVQVLRTIPEMNFTLDPEARKDFLKLEAIDLLKPKKLWGIKGHRPKIKPAIAFSSVLSKISGYNRHPLNFAPHGCFEFKVALKKAISEAENYIFIADQAFYGLEIMDWINSRITQCPKLKVILLYGADPADPPSDIVSEAMSNHLLSENADISKDNDNEPINIVFFEWVAQVVHCKVTIIDDVWCAIGSANCMRRSLYTDIELSLSILEPPTESDKLPRTYAEELNPVSPIKAPSYVQRFRRDLWAHYCNIPLAVNTRDPTQDQILTNMLNLNFSLSIWNPVRWRALTKTRIKDGDKKQPLRPDIIRKQLSNFSNAGKFDADAQNFYNLVDADSRQNF